MTHTRECRFPWDLELTSDTVGDAADCCGTLVDIADTRGKTRGSRGTLADTADVRDIGIRTQKPRCHHYLIRQGDLAGRKKKKLGRENKDHYLIRQGDPPATRGDWGQIRPRSMMVQDMEKYF